MSVTNIVSRPAIGDVPSPGAALRRRPRFAWRWLSLRAQLLIVFILVAALAGFLAGKVMTGHGLGVIWDIVVGILGAFLGGWLAGLVGIGVSNIVVEIVVAFVGACILLFLFRMIFRGRGMVRT